jgi:energy-coupling factor transport system permease protein
MVLGVLINPDWHLLIFYLLTTALAMKISGMDWHFASRSLRSIRYLLLITFAFQAVLTPGNPVFELGLLSVTREGLRLGSINLARLLILYFVSMVLLRTTSPFKLSAGIEALFLPLSKLKIPIHDFITILSISFRFIPTLIDQAVVIKNAQQSRGAQFDAPKLGIRLKSYLAILIPLFETSLSRAGDIGEAMDSRCYTGRPNQLRISRLHMKPLDLAIIVFLLLGSALGTFISLMG